MTAVYLLSATLGDRDQTDLPYFLEARHLIGSGHGLQTYVEHPEMQIGPLALGGVSGLDAVGPHVIGLLSVGAALVLLVTLLACTARLVPPTTRTPAGLAVSGSALAAAWAVAVPGWGHLDDLAALTAMVGALLATQRSRGLTCGLLLAVGCGCKPWGLFAAAMLLLLPRRAALRGAVALALGLAVIWLPFLLAAPSTWEALSHYAIRTSPGSLPRLLGDAYAPGWVRPAQLVVATAAIAGCVRARRPDLVMLAFATSRLALDAGVFSYYGVELVAAAAVADVMAVRYGGRWPATAILCWVGWELVDQASSQRVLVPMRLALLAIVFAVAWHTGRPPAASGSTARVVSATTSDPRRCAQHHQATATSSPSGTASRITGDDPVTPEVPRVTKSTGNTSVVTTMDASVSRATTSSAAS